MNVEIIDTRLNHLRWRYLIDKSKVRATKERNKAGIPMYKNISFASEGKKNEKTIAEMDKGKTIKVIHRRHFLPLSLIKQGLKAYWHTM